MKRDRRTLLGIGIIAVAFVAWELGGISPDFPSWHSISFYGYHLRWVQLLVFVCFLAGGIGGAIWWLWHSSRYVPK